MLYVRRVPVLHFSFASFRCCCCDEKLTVLILLFWKTKFISTSESSSSCSSAVVGVAGTHRFGEWYNGRLLGDKSKSWSVCSTKLCCPWLLSPVQDIVAEIQTDSRYMECRMNEVNFLISLELVKGGRDVGDPMLIKEKCREGVHAPPTLEKSEN